MLSEYLVICRPSVIGQERNWLPSITLALRQLSLSHIGEWPSCRQRLTAHMCWKLTPGIGQAAVMVTSDMASPSKLAPKFLHARCSWGGLAHFKIPPLALAGWLSWLKHHPLHVKVAGLIPGQGTYSGCGFDPLGCI